MEPVPREARKGTLSNVTETGALGSHRQEKARPWAGTAGEGTLPRGQATAKVLRFVFPTLHELAGIRSSGLRLPTDEQLEEQVITIIPNSISRFISEWANQQV